MKIDRKIDASDMLTVIHSLPTQIEESLSADVAFETEGKRIIVAGMGGSAIAGDILGVWLEQSGGFLHVVRDSTLPGWVDSEDTLACVSYSGNTAETLACLHEGIKRGCQILCISSGGKMKDVCDSEFVPLIEAPGGLPPRGALGHLFTLLGRALVQGTDLSDNLRTVVTSLSKLREELAPESEPNEARAIADQIVFTSPAIYAGRDLLPVARRWKTQLNENSKKLAWFSGLPEIAHNEVVGWDLEDGTDSFCAIFLRDEPNRQADSTIAEVKKRAKVVEVVAEGDTLLERAFHVLMVGDFVSYYCALMRGIDPTPVDAIQRVKNLR